MFIRTALSVFVALLLPLSMSAQVTAVAPSDTRLMYQTITVDGQQAQGVTVMNNGMAQVYSCPSPRYYVIADQSAGGWACYDQSSGMWLLNAQTPQQSTATSYPSDSTTVYVAPNTVQVYDNSSPSYPYYGYPYGSYPYGYPYSRARYYGYGYPYSYPYANYYGYSPYSFGYYGPGFGIGLGFGYGNRYGNRGSYANRRIYTNRPMFGGRIGVNRPLIVNRPFATGPIITNRPFTGGGPGVRGGFVGGGGGRGFGGGGGRGFGGGGGRGGGRR